jgi:hypothetical protein
MTITKSDIKILNYVHYHHRHPVTYAKLVNKFSIHEIDVLIQNEFLDYIPEIFEHHGIPSMHITGNSIMSLTKKGIHEVEQNQWFDIRYLITQILVPILVGTVSAIVTAILLNVI